MGQHLKFGRRSVEVAEHLRCPWKRRSAALRARIDLIFFLNESYVFGEKVVRFWYLNATDEILYTTSEAEDPRFFDHFQVLF